MWRDDSQLIAAVFTGIQHLKKSRPAVGWIKGSEASDAALKDELIGLRRKAEILAAELEDARGRSEPEGTNELAHGTDEVPIRIDFGGPGQSPHQRTSRLQWQEILRAVLPNTFGGGADDSRVAGALSDLVKGNLDGMPAGPTTVSVSDFGKVMNQMVALGLIEGRPHPANPASTLWVATPYGKQAGARMLALKRSDS